MKWLKKIESLNPCADALAWLRTQPDAATAWRDCKRGDRMLWLIGKTDKSKPYSPERRPIVRVACECARLAWQWMPPASRDALVVIERWSAGDDSVTVERLGQARKAAAYAYAAYAANAANAAAYAANAANAAAYAAYAAYAAADAADAADAAAYARRKTLAQCADIVRKHHPEPPVN